MSAVPDCLCVACHISWPTVEISARRCSSYHSVGSPTYSHVAVSPASTPSLDAFPPHISKYLIALKLRRGPDILLLPAAHPQADLVHAPVHPTPAHHRRPDEQVQTPRETPRDIVAVVLDVFEEQELAAWFEQGLDDGHDGGEGGAWRGA